MMTLDTVTTLLIAIAPALSAVLTVIGGLIAITRKAKERISRAEESSQKRIESVQRDISTIKSKLTSIENILAERGKH